MLKYIKVFFFPFYKRNQILKKYWWHRFLVVLFTLIIICSWISVWGWANGVEAEPRNICVGMVVDEEVHSNNYGFIPDSGGTTQNDSFDKCVAEYPVHQFLNLIYATIGTLIISYGLQLIYFIIFYYIIFGSSKNRTI